MELELCIFCNVCAGDFCGLLYVLLLRHLIVCRTEDLDGAAVAVKADLLERISVACMRQAVALGTRPQTLLIVIVVSAAAPAARYRYVSLPAHSPCQLAHRAAEPFGRCQRCLQRVTLADTQGSSDLLWDDDAAEIVDPPHNSGCFHAVLPPIYGSSVVMVVVFTVNRK